MFKDGISWEMTTDAFDVHVSLLEKFCYAALTANTFAIILVLKRSTRNQSFI